MMTPVFAPTRSLPGRALEDVLPHLERLWALGFKVLDDVKETVALAGLELAKSLSQLTARLCNREESSADNVRGRQGVRGRGWGRGLVRRTTVEPDRMA
jgi:hypothetical protein